jgi:UDP-N-acetylglucosamine/UDP-N-acetylgalactosamine 4-epimerase
MTSPHKILVTGGAGFIGSHICDKLLDMGFEVKCLDNLSTSKIENIQHLLDNNKFEFVKGDIRDYDLVNDAIKDCTHVTHQAALGSVPRSIDNPFTTNEVNISGSLNVLICSKNNNIKRFVFASSSSVYGDNMDLPKIENRTGELLSPYAVTKATVESYASTFNKVYGLETVGLRYFNIFGPRQSPDGPYAAVIPKFMDAIYNNKESTIYGDGEQTRDFTYVENAVNANILALFSEDLKDFGIAFNVACGETISINNLYITIKKEFTELLQNEILADVKHVSERLGDVRNSLADLTNIKKYLNYEPKITVSDGVKNTVEWYLIGR